MSTSHTFSAWLFAKLEDPERSNVTRRVIADAVCNGRVQTVSEWLHQGAVPGSRILSRLSEVLLLDYDETAAMIAAIAATPRPSEAA